MVMSRAQVVSLASEAAEEDPAPLPKDVREQHPDATEIHSGGDEEACEEGEGIPNAQHTQ